MHRSVFEAIVRTRDRLARIIEETEKLRYDPQWLPLRDGGMPKEMVAVDGSFNQSPRTSHIILALTGLSLLFSKENEYRERALSHVDVLDRGVFHRVFFKEVVETWMRLAEIKSVLQLDPPEGVLILIDGSLVSDIINPKPTPKWINAELSDVDREQMGGLDDELASMGLYDRISEEFNRYPFTSLHLLDSSPIPGKKEHRYMALALLLYYEHLEAISRLITGGWRLVFISKGSISNDYIRSMGLVGIYSDQVLFSRFTKGRGYAPPLKVRFKEEKYELGERYEHILGVEAYQTFVRFSEFSPLTYKVEMVGVPQEEVEEVLSQIATVSPGGYPIPLEKVHKEVVITHRDMEIVSQALVPVEMSVREALR